MLRAASCGPSMRCLSFAVPAAARCTPSGFSGRRRSRHHGNYAMRTGRRTGFGAATIVRGSVFGCRNLAHGAHPVRRFLDIGSGPDFCSMPRCVAAEHRRSSRIELLPPPLADRSRHPIIALVPWTIWTAASMPASASSHRASDAAILSVLLRNWRRDRAPVRCITSTRRNVLR